MNECDAVQHGLGWLSGGLKRNSGRLLMPLNVADNRPPLWARNNARKAIELMDGTPAYVSLLKVKVGSGQVIRKSAAETLFKGYLRGMEAEGRLIVTGNREFIAPCLGTFFVSVGGEVERNVLFSRISYKIHKSRLAVENIPFMNIPHHAFGRIFERDLRPPAEVAGALVSKDFIDKVLELHCLATPDAHENSFAIRFLGGFLTGTVRMVITGNDAVETKVLDVRTFMPASDKTDWVPRTSDNPYFLFEYSDRRTKNAAIDRITDLLENSTKSFPFGAGATGFKELPPEA